MEIHENIDVNDHVGLLAEQNGKIVGFRESEREGRAAAADINDDGTYFFRLQVPVHKVKRIPFPHAAN